MSELRCWYRSSASVRISQTAGLRVRVWRHVLSPSTLRRNEQKGPFTVLVPWSLPLHDRKPTNGADVRAQRDESIDQVLSISRKRFLVGLGTAAVGVAIHGSAAAGTSGPTGTQGVFNVKDMGAVGDGSTDDSRSIQAAISAARTAGGGVVYFPRGVYRCQATLTLPAQHEVNLVGDGMNGSELRFSTDLGRGAYAVTFDQPVTNFTKHVIRDMAITGPRSVDALGQSPAQMDGIKLMARVVLDRCRVEWFRAGVVVFGDHQELYSCLIKSNHYGMYFASSPPTSGDMTVVACDFSGSKFAGIAIASDHFMNSASLISTHFGWSPYGIYREPGSGLPQYQTAIIGCVFTDCAFESIGNGLFYEETPGSSGIHGCIFDSLSFSWDDASRIPSRSKRAIITAQSISASRLTIGQEGSWEPGEASVFDLRGVSYGVTVENAGRLLVNLPPDKVVCVAPHGCQGWAFRHGGAWSARLIRVRPDSAPVEREELLEFREGQVQPSTGSAAPVAGVALHRASAGRLVLVAHEGETFVKSASVANNTYLKKSPTKGCVASARDWNDGPIVGVALNLEATRCRVSLRIPA